MEVGVLVFYLAMALLGFFRSSWFLALGWLLHVPWDFVPRELPELLVDLPMACMLFVWILAAYLAWASFKKRWKRADTAWF